MNGITASLLATTLSLAPVAASAAEDAMRLDARTSPLSDEARQMLNPPAEVVEIGNEAPLIRYGRHIRGGAHTQGSWSGGWQVTHALAVFAGNSSAEDRMLEQVVHTLEPRNTISANGGYPAQHERLITAAYAILRHAPHFWENRLTAEQRHKINLLMKASLIASAYTTADATYANGAKPTALDGDTNLHRNWNPNFREGILGGLLVGSVYFWGSEPAQAILADYDHGAFVAELEAADLRNPHETFTWARTHPDSGAPSGEKIEQHVRNYRLNGQPLPEPMALYRELTLDTYRATVNCGLNDGRGVDVDGVAAGVIVSGCDDLPNKGEKGMLAEFDSRDGNGARSSVEYSYHGFRPNLANHAALVAGGFWEPGSEADELLRLLDVGITDLRYKLEQGYRNYSKGRGSTNAFDIQKEHWTWSFQTMLPLWDEVLKPYHAEPQ